MSAPSVSNNDQCEDGSKFDNLCKLCAALFDEGATWTEDGYWDHHDVHALVRSAEAGCHLCSLIQARIDPDDIAVLQKNIGGTAAAKPSRQIGINIRGEHTVSLWVAAWNTSILPKGWDTCTNGWTGIARFHIRAKPDDYTQESRSTSLQNFSESSKTQIYNWIEECDSLHSQCRDAHALAAKQKILPTRLLDLSTALEDKRIRLCSSESLRPGMRYATLSHCWGGSCRKELTEDNILDFEKGIPLSSLPATFQDAVNVTRQLGLYYLWIDALCIIQHSEDDSDWTREAAKMDDIYALSYFTLAATTSPNSEGGLLHQRSPLSVWPCRVTATWKCFPGGELVISSPDWAGDTDLEPLASRAWAFQEWLLSKRLVHFGKDQVRWQCYCRSASEVYPDGSSDNNTEMDSYGIPTKNVVVRMMQHRMDRQKANLWDQIREDYSQKALTRETDRLTALIGVARMAHRALDSPGQEYLAGLWRPHLLQELLWARDRETASSSTPGAPYISPTWSWASLGAPFSRFGVETKLQSIDWLVKVVEAQTLPVGDAFGPVKAGALILETSTLSQIAFTSTQSRDFGEISTINTVDVRYIGRARLDHSVATPSQTLTFYFVPIRASYSEVPDQNTTAGLLLEETGKRRGQYHRTGLLQIFPRESQQQLRSVLNKGRYSGDNCYLETESRADRLIEIV